MLTDIEIAQQAKMKNIRDIAAELGIIEDEIMPIGHYKAKITDRAVDRVKNNKDG